MVLRNGDIVAGLRPADAVRWAAEAIDAHHRGELIAPPRTYAGLGGGRLVFTAGRLQGSWFGYRSYDTFPLRSPGGISVFFSVGLAGTETYLRYPLAHRPAG